MITEMPAVAGLPASGLMTRNKAAEPKIAINPATGPDSANVQNPDAMRRGSDLSVLASVERGFLTGR